MITIHPSTNPMFTRAGDPASTLLGSRVVGVSGTDSNSLTFHFEGGGSIHYQSEPSIAQEAIQKSRDEWGANDRAQQTAAIVSAAESLEKIADTYTDARLNKPSEIELFCECGAAILFRCENSNITELMCSNCGRRLLRTTPPNAPPRKPPTKSPEPADRSPAAFYQLLKATTDVVTLFDIQVMSGWDNDKDDFYAAVERLKAALRRGTEPPR